MNDAIISPSCFPNPEHPRISDKKAMYEIFYYMKERGLEYNEEEFLSNNSEGELSRGIM